MTTKKNIKRKEEKPRTTHTLQENGNSVFLAFFFCLKCVSQMQTTPDDGDIFVKSNHKAYKRTK